MPQITNITTHNCFTATTEQTLLDAALAAGLGYPHGCTRGLCQKCKVEIISGEVTYPEGIPQSVVDDTKHALICKAHAITDIVLKADEITLMPSTKEMNATVVELTKLNHDVLKISLQTPQSLEFLAGQYVEISYGDFAARAFSIANKSGNDILEFHIRIIEGGAFTHFLDNELKLEDSVHIKGPLGDFYLREDDKDILLVAGGTGLAPVKAMIEELQSQNDTRNITFYWGVRDMCDMYLDFAQELRGSAIHFIPVLSEPSDGWSGRVGYAHQAVLEDVSDFSNYAVYACGPPAMVEAVAMSFASRGMDKNHFFNDRFEFNTQS